MGISRTIQMFVCRYSVFTIFVLSVNSVSAENYYVDNISGSNANIGLSGFPWKDMERVNNFDFQPGDVIHLRRGQTWQGQYISLTESGTGADPIKVTNYGPETDPLPIVMGAAPLDMEFRGKWDMDIHTVNIGGATDDFMGWAVSATLPTSVKAVPDTYLGTGVSAKLQYISGTAPRMWRNMPIATAADLPILFRLRLKVESGNLTLKIRNLETKNYYNQNGTWGPSAAAAVFSSTQYSSWSEVPLVVPNDAMQGQYEISFSASGTALIDDVSFSTQWVEHSPNIYKRAILAETVNGVYTIYHGEALAPKQNSVAALAQDFDWAIDTTERALYIFYSGSLEALNAEPLLADRGSFELIGLAGTNLTVDGLQLEKSSVGIRSKNDNVIVSNNYIHHMGRCGVLVHKQVGTEVPPSFNATTTSNVVSDSSCGIYYWRVHNSLISGNTLSNIRDRGDGVDIEILGLQSVTNSIIERNLGYDGIMGIDLWGGPGYPAFGNTFRYNTMHDIDYVGIIMGGTQDDHGVIGGPVRGYVYGNLIHHNLFFNNGFSPGLESKGSGMRQNNTPREEDGPNYWYNNTLYANRFNFSGSSGFAGRFVFRNNISLAPVEGHLEFPGSGGITNDLTSAELSNNLYYPDGNSLSPLFDWRGVYETFNQYITSSLKDTNGSFIGDPTLKNPSINPLSADFSLQSESPAVDAGIDVGLYLDFAGNPVVGMPDIGAYEYPGADLSVTVSDSPESVNTDSPMTYDIIASNTGPSDATNVVLSHVLSAGVTGSGIPSQGSCTGTSVISCNLGAIPNGQSVTVTVTAIPSAEALFDSTPDTTFVVNASTTTTVSLTEVDTTPGNNSTLTTYDVHLACLGQPVTLRGTGDNDGTSSKRFAGDNGADVIHTLSGDDWIEGKGSNDTICGGAGDDDLRGNGGDDTLSGGSGTDVCKGNNGVDSTDGSCETWIQ